MFNVSWNHCAHLRFWLSRLKLVRLQRGLTGNCEPPRSFKATELNPGSFFWTVRLTLHPNKENWVHHLQANALSQITAVAGRASACSQPLTIGEGQLLFRIKGQTLWPWLTVWPLQHFCDKHFWNLNIFKGSLSKGLQERAVGVENNNRNM